MAEVISEINGLGKQYLVLNGCKKIMVVLSKGSWAEIDEVEDINGNKCVKLFTADFFWKYFDKEEIIKGNMLEVSSLDIKCRPNTKAVLQLKDGELIRKFRSVYSASKETGVTYAGIYNCCNGGRYAKSAGGFEWKYATDTE